MIAEFVLALESNNKSPQVVAGNAGYILALRAEEVDKVASTIGNPADGLWALPLSPSISFVSYQRVLKRHHFKVLTLIAYTRGRALNMAWWGFFVKAGALFSTNFLGKG